MNVSGLFEIHSGSEIIGWSKFEHRDSNNGVAFGRFIPGPGYKKVRQQIRATVHEKNRSAAQSRLDLRVRSPAGAVFDPHGCISIGDASDAEHPEDIEVEIVSFADFKSHFSVTRDA